MMNRTLIRAFFAFGLGILVILFAILPDSPITPRAAALTNPCALDPNNLIINGSMKAANPDNGVADHWNTFVVSGSPTFEHVDNEQIDPYGSQYIWADISTFDAGIYQTVSGLTPGAYYHFWWGYALAAHDPGTGQNIRTNLIGRVLGIDLTGGVDPTSPNVIWGNVFWNGQAALNISALSWTFAAQTSQATFFLRNINTDPTGRNKVWMDSICMEPTNPPVLTPRVFLPMVFNSSSGKGAAPTVSPGSAP
jgi:hypothetical protein